MDQSASAAQSAAHAAFTSAEAAACRQDVLRAALDDAEADIRRLHDIAESPAPELPPEPLPSPRRLELLHSTGALREELRAAAQDLDDARSATRGSEAREA